MTSGAAAALVLCLLVYAMPAQAQEQPEGPLMRAVRKEANRLAAAHGNVAPAMQDWPRVTRLAPGREIYVEVRGGPAASRIFVTANESDLIVLDLTHPSVTPEVRRVMRDGVSRPPSTSSTSSPDHASFMATCAWRLTASLSRIARWPRFQTSSHESPGPTSLSSQCRRNVAGR